MKVDNVAFEALLRNALWQIPMVPGSLLLDFREWAELYSYAGRQGVTTILWDSLEASGATVPDELRALWKAKVSQVEAGNALMDAVVKAQKKKWKQSGVNAYLLKGQSVAAMYPVPQHRLCGDVDWYFPTKADWNQAKEIATAVTGAAPETDSDGDIHYLWEGVVIEHHKRWHHASNRRSRRYLDTQGDLQPYMYDILSLNTHILRHAMVLGVGVRQICDLAMAYTHYAGSIDGQAYRKHLKKIHLLRWTNMLHSYLVSELGMPAEYLPFPLRRRYKRNPLSRIVERSGNLGLRKTRKNKLDRGAVLVENYLRCAPLFLRIAPKEFISRGSELAKGRIARLDE